MKINSKVLLASRLILGLMFLVFGLNGFLNFIALPTPTPEAGAFLGALAKTGFIFPIVKIIEILFGLALITNRFVPLALVVITPILTVITLHNTILDTAGLPNIVMILILFTIITIGHWNYFKQLLTMKTDV